MLAFLVFAILSSIYSGQRDWLQWLGLAVFSVISFPYSFFIGRYVQCRVELRGQRIVMPKSVKLNVFLSIPLLIIFVTFPFVLILSRAQTLNSLNLQHFHLYLLVDVGLVYFLTLLTVYVLLQSQQRRYRTEKR